MVDCYCHLGILSDHPFPIYIVVQHWLLAISRDHIAVGLSLSQSTQIEHTHTNSVLFYFTPKEHT